MIGNDIYNAPSNARTLEFKSLRWAGHADKGDKECIQNFGEETSSKAATWKSEKNGRKYGKVF